MAKVDLRHQETHQLLLVRAILRPHQRFDLTWLLERDLHLHRFRGQAGIARGDGHP